MNQTADPNTARKAWILDLLRGLVREMNLSAIIVTHDLAVVRLLADRRIVMKDGHVVGTGPTDQVLGGPQYARLRQPVSAGCATRVHPRRYDQIVAAKRIVETRCIGQGRKTVGAAQYPTKAMASWPTTFEGEEQQRGNIARGIAYPYPALLLDETTASLDPSNRATVLAMIEEAKARGAAIVGIFHDQAARDQFCDRMVDVANFTPQSAA